MNKVLALILLLSSVLFQNNYAQDERASISVVNSPEVEVQPEDKIPQTETLSAAQDELIYIYDVQAHVPKPAPEVLEILRAMEAQLASETSQTAGRWAPTQDKQASAPLVETPQEADFKAAEKPIFVAVLELNETSELTFLSGLDRALASDMIDAIIVRASGDDGYSLGLGYVFYSEFKKAQEEKPIVAVVREECLGTCYYSIAGTTKIIATPVALLGGLSVVHSVERLRGEHIGTEEGYANLLTTLIAVGTFSTIFQGSAEDLTQQQREHLKQIAQDQYDQVCEDVASARNLSLNARAAWADGRIFTGRMASASKTGALADGVGFMSEAKELIRALLKERGVSVNENVIILEGDST